MAEAVARQVASGVLRVCSAGTDPETAVNADAIETLSRHGYGIAGLSPKSLKDLPSIDILITMGCGVQCPVVSCAYREDWALEDPTDRGVEAFEACLRQIEEKVSILKSRVQHE